MKTTYRIQREDKTIVNAGTDEPSWFSLEDARSIINLEKNERIIESDGVNILWEVL